jgi:AraC family transcriptional regulator of adaptative response/methylated-DNA-[protein]-cysteine methyltransferase
MNHQTDHKFSTEDARWDALVRRDREANGAFVYGVLTTFVYCRPACSSRRPKLENVRFFDTCEEAEQAGFRPCKRCNPKSSVAYDTSTAAIVNACKMIEASEEPLSLGNLAAAVGLSPFHFQRLFKKIIGITPKQYTMEKRLKRVRTGLKKDSTVTEAIYDAGFASSSRFYENVHTTLGMKPSEYRTGADGIRIRYAVAQSYLGWVLIAATAKGICAIDFGDDPEILKDRLRAKFPKAELQADDARFRTWVAQVLAFLESPRRTLELPLDIQGTAFQRRVWMALREIPPGSTASYADIAAQIGKPKAARAVAQACASNVIAVAIPCHRVVRSDGNLGGYRWGVERKLAVLDREAKEL